MVLFVLPDFLFPPIRLLHYFSLKSLYKSRTAKSNPLELSFLLVLFIFSSIIYVVNNVCVIL